MIHVEKQPEPDNFDERVRKRGQTFRSKIPNPGNSEWKNKEYWREAIPDLRKAYSGICAYCCVWIPRTTGNSSVDHFIPRSVAPHLAYEWDNFRLASATMNSRKSRSTDIIDPFLVEDGWFQLVFPEMLVIPNLQLPENIKKQVIKTINDILDLNDETLIEERFEFLQQFCYTPIRLPDLKRSAPFIAIEIERQQLTKTSLKKRLKMPNN